MNRNLKPENVGYEDGEYQKIVRAWLAVKMRVLPSEIDKMPYEDAIWLIATLNEDSKPHG